MKKNLKKLAIFFAAALMIGFTSCNDSDSSETASIDGTWKFSTVSTETDNPGVNAIVNTLDMVTNITNPYKTQFANQTITFTEADKKVTCNALGVVAFNYALDGKNLSIINPITGNTTLTGTLEGSTLSIKAYDITSQINELPAVQAIAQIQSGWVVVKFTK